MAGDDANVAMTIEQVSTIHRLLSDYIRRYILRYVIVNESQTYSTEEIANHINAASFGRELDGASREEIIVTLHHNHLPRLKELGIVDYEPKSRQLKYWGDDVIEALVEATPRGL